MYFFLFLQFRLDSFCSRRDDVQCTNLIVKNSTLARLRIRRKSFKLYNFLYFGVFPVVWSMGILLTVYLRHLNNNCWARKIFGDFSSVSVPNIGDAPPRYDLPQNLAYNITGLYDCLKLMGLYTRAGYTREEEGFTGPFPPKPKEVILQLNPQIKKARKHKFSTENKPA